MNAALVAEWRAELERRISRARLLVNHGLPDEGFAFLTFEIMRFRAATSSMRMRA